MLGIYFSREKDIFWLETHPEKGLKQRACRFKDVLQAHQERILKLGHVPDFTNQIFKNGEFWKAQSPNQV